MIEDSAIDHLREAGNSTLHAGTFMGTVLILLLAIAVRKMFTSPFAWCLTATSLTLATVASAADLIGLRGHYELELDIVHLAAVWFFLIGIFSHLVSMGALSKLVNDARPR